MDGGSASLNKEQNVGVEEALSAVNMKIIAVRNVTFVRLGRPSDSVCSIEILPA